MILYKKKSSTDKDKKLRGLKDSYIIVNIIFTGVILLILAYSGIFSPEKNNYPVICIHEKITGEPCFSCGLSHSFSLILRGRLNEAYLWNVYGMRVFLFFISQLLLRVTYSMFYIRFSETRRELIIIDCIGSGLIFLISFWPFIANLMHAIFK